MVEVRFKLIYDAGQIKMTLGRRAGKVCHSIRISAQSPEHFFCRCRHTGRRVFFKNLGRIVYIVGRAIGPAQHDRNTARQRLGRRACKVLVLTRLQDEIRLTHQFGNPCSIHCVNVFQALWILEAVKKLFVSRYERKSTDDLETYADPAIYQQCASVEKQIKALARHHSAEPKNDRLVRWHKRSTFSKCL